MVPSSFSLPLHYWPARQTLVSFLLFLLLLGNVGHFLLDQTASDINTYYSRDAGETWIEVAKGPHIFEIADHGAITLLAKDYEPTDKLL